MSSTSLEVTPVQKISRGRALFILAAVAIAGWWFVGRESAGAQELASTPSQAAKAALQDVVKDVSAWQKASGTAIGAPHPGVRMAAGDTIWGVSMMVKHQDGESCAIGGSLDGGPTRIIIAPDTTPCTDAGIAELQSYICTQEQLATCPKP